jgi:transglutaminase-like putative cysteine protease
MIPPPRRALVALAALLVAAPAFADGPIVHEYVPFDPATESELGVVTTEGGFASELLTRSGKISAPDPGRPIGDRTPTYGTKPKAEPDKFVPDRDVRRVDHLSYDDPFRPRLAPFKRLVAFDSVTSDYVLEVRDRRHTRVDIGRESLRRGHADPFYADIALELKATEPIRIPSAIAGNVIKRAHLSPPVGFHLERDPAENLFVVAQGAGSARLVLEIEAPREAFGNEYDGDWSDLLSAPGGLALLPAGPAKAAAEIARELGLDKTTMRPREVIRSLVAYFRAFKESEDPPPNTGDVYLDITRSKKGVCRHRAFAFMVTALGLGIPTRFVHNEAHAWVEVYDGYLYRRIDLGGAGRVMDDRSEKPESPQPQHEPPPDPYTWPAGATRGSDLVPPPSGGGAGGSNGGNGNGGGAPPPVPTPSPTTTATPPSTAPPSKVGLVVGSGGEGELVELQRTKSISVRGRIHEAGGGPCKDARVDIVFKQPAKGFERVVRALKTDDKGDYAGDVAVPSDLPLGDYTISAQTPGAGTCGQGSSD